MKWEQVIALMKCDDPPTQSRAASVISRCIDHKVVPRRLDLPLFLITPPYIAQIRSAPPSPATTVCAAAASLCSRLTQRAASVISRCIDHKVVNPQASTL